MNKQKKIIVILSILLAVVVLANIVITYRIIQQKKTYLDVVEYEYQFYPRSKFECDLSKQEIKAILDACYNISYIYEEVDTISQNADTICLGEVDFKTNTIAVAKWITLEDYIYTLAHELTHLKYKTENETFVEYTSLVTLYETNVPAFQTSALNRARFIVSGEMVGTLYDCGYYLLKYFGGKL